MLGRTGDPAIQCAPAFARSESTKARFRSDARNSADSSSRRADSIQEGKRRRAAPSGEDQKAWSSFSYARNAGSSCDARGSERGLERRR
jgi:hypothetical protein